MAAKSKKSIVLIIAALVALLLLLCPITQFSSNALSSGQATVIASRCNLYNEAAFESGKVTVLDSEEQPVIITLRLGDTLSVSETQGDFAKVTTSKGIEGWVYKFYLTQNTSQDVYPVFNGTVLKDTAIYTVDLEESGHTAKTKDRIYLYEGFDEKRDYTAVQIALEDGTLYTGYLSTKDIEPDGVSSALIVAITVISAAVTIILSIVFIRRSKKKKDKKKEKKA